MNLFAVARFALHCSVLVFVVCMIWLGRTDSLPFQSLPMWGGFGLAVLFFTVLLVLGWLRPLDAQQANDELARETYRSAHLWGYFATLVVFLILLISVRAEQVSPGQAFFWMGLPLIVPSFLMALGFLRGRAG